MSMTNRQRGDYFERQVRDTLAGHGYRVTRAAGSRGPYDLVALRADKSPALIQCKLSGRIDPAERVALCDAAEMAGGRALVGMRARGGRVLLATVVPGWGRLVNEETLHIPARPRAVVSS